MGDHYLLAAGVFAVVALVQVALRLALGPPQSRYSRNRYLVGMVLAPAFAVILFAAWLMKR